MDIKPGWYRMRDGDKAYVVAELPDGVRIPGRPNDVFVGFRSGRIQTSWLKDGRWSSNCEFAYDLISPIDDLDGKKALIDGVEYELRRVG